MFRGVIGGGGGIRKRAARGRGQSGEVNCGSPKMIVEGGTIQWNARGGGQRSKVGQVVVGFQWGGRKLEFLP